MTSKHTPGPWYADPTDDDVEFVPIFAKSDDEFPVAQAMALPEPSGENEFILDDTVAANARLIAEAPTLLALLTEVLQMLEQRAMPNWDDPWFSDARAAIAKAEGR